MVPVTAMGEEPPPDMTETPPNLPNPRGTRFVVAVSIVLVLMTIVVFMRLWGRARYKSPLKATNMRRRDSMFWVLISDVTVVVSYLLAVALTGVCYGLVHWGEGLHQKQLSIPQVRQVAKLFYIYQILYKFLSGLAKIATLLLLLAISTSQMRNFNRFCKGLAVYIALYCVATSVATVFQCGTSFESNWNKKADQSQCFVLPPFWFTHAAINVTATAAMIPLPWWLFASITYKRKFVIATIMSLFAAGETALGIVRFYGLYQSSHSANDVSYGTVTGILVSQLEVDFACIVACVPTVLKMSEELWSLFAIYVLHMPSLAGQTYSKQGRTDGTSQSHGTGKLYSDHALSELRSVDREPKPTGPYVNFDKEPRDESDRDDSQEFMVGDRSGARFAKGGINVQTEYVITTEENPMRFPSEIDDGRHGTGSTAYQARVISR